jgi:hypothetical protein
MPWDHKKKQKQLALEAMSRSGIHRLVKVVPHRPGQPKAQQIAGWVTQEIFVAGRSPEELEKLLGFDSRPGRAYLQNGFDVYAIAEQIQESDFDLGGAYTYLPNGKEWDGRDLKWPPGSGATQWKLTRHVACRFLQTVARGQKYQPAKA